MILQLHHLEMIKSICEDANVDTFTLSAEPNNSGIGTIVTLTYNTCVADYPAKMSIEISGVGDW